MKTGIRADTERVLTEQAFIAKGKHTRREREKREKATASGVTMHSARRLIRPRG